MQRSVKESVALRSAGNRLSPLSVKLKVLRFVTSSLLVPAISRELRCRQGAMGDTLGFTGGLSGRDVHRSGFVDGAAVTSSAKALSLSPDSPQMPQVQTAMTRSRLK